MTFPLSCPLSTDTQGNGHFTLHIEMTLSVYKSHVQWSLHCAHHLPTYSFPLSPSHLSPSPFPLSYYVFSESIGHHAFDTILLLCPSTHPHPWRLVSTDPRAKRCIPPRAPLGRWCLLLRTARFPRAPSLSCLVHPLFSIVPYTLPIAPLVILLSIPPSPKICLSPIPCHGHQ